jgi:RNA polymerase primary sigma factor
MVSTLLPPPKGAATPIKKAPTVAELKRLELVRSLSIDYIDSPEFSRPELHETILAERWAPDARAADCGVHEGTSRAPRGLPTYLAGLYLTRLLTREEEAHLFRRMNFLKCQAARLQSQLKLRRPQSEALNQLESLLQQAAAVQQELVRANLRLVVSIAKKHVTPVMGLDELISDGNLTLLRAVEKFDYSLGNKFSTYATWAIRRNYYRAIVKGRNERQRFVTGDDEQLQLAADDSSNERLCTQRYDGARAVVGKIMKKLDRRDQAILAARFGLGKEAEPLVLQKIAKNLGISKERVRQLQIRALDKLRTLAEEHAIDLPEEE